MISYLTRKINGRIRIALNFADDIHGILGKFTDEQGKNRVHVHYTFKGVEQTSWVSIGNLDV